MIDVYMQMIQELDNGYRIFQMKILFSLVFFCLLIWKMRVRVKLSNLFRVMFFIYFDIRNFIFFILVFVFIVLFGELLRVFLVKVVDL